MSSPLTFPASDEMLAQFLAESDELLQELDMAVLDLEREPANGAVLQQIFRITHTLKSSSAAIGHRPFSELAHGLEGLLDCLRSGAMAATRELVDLLLQSLDALRALTDEVRTRTSAGLDVTGLMARIAGAATARAVTVAPGLHRAEITFADSTPMPAVRALQALLALGEAGHVVWSQPTQEQIEREEIERRLSALVVTAIEPEAVRLMLLAVGDIAACTVEPAEEAEIAGQTDSTPAPTVESLTPADSDLPSPPLPDQVSAAAQPPATRRSRTVRVDVEQLDALMNLVGELVVDRTQLQRLAARAEDLPADDRGLDGLADTALHIERVTTELQVEVMKARMLPVEHVFNRFPRIVRDLARRFDKEVRLIIEGADTELDRSVIEEISEPLLHLLRNSIDHGIETPSERIAAGKPRTGTLRLAARHDAGQIVIEIADDGRGIDGRVIRQTAVERGLLPRDRAATMDAREALNLIFLPGLTTAREVSDVSGRGVGMDAVRVCIEHLNGSIAIATTPGRGTRFAIRLPLTLAIVRALLVRVDEQVYALPLGSVVETMMVDPSVLRWVHRRGVVDLRGSVMPILPLAGLLHGRDDQLVPADGRILAVAVQHGSRQIGLQVDSLVGEQEIVIKPLDPLFGGIGCIGGAAILGDGQIAPIVNVPGLIKELAEAGQSLVPVGAEG